MHRNTNTTDGGKGGHTSGDAIRYREAWEMDVGNHKLACAGDICKTLVPAVSGASFRVPETQNTGT